MNIIDENKRPTKCGKLVLFFSIIHFIISFLTDRLTFDSVPNYSYYAVKPLFLFLLFGLWYGIINVIIRLKNKDKEIGEFIKLFLPFFIVSVIYMCLVWPGNWIWDDMRVYMEACKGYCYYWQHFLTSQFYMLSMMLIPCAGGIVVIQLLLISFISAYIIKTVRKNFPTGRCIALLYIPFFLFPTIYLNSHPLRLTLYAYLDLLFITLFADSFRNRLLTWPRTVIMIVLSVLLATWRTEGIYYILLVPILFLILYMRIASKKQKVYFCSIFLTASVVITLVQNFSNGNGDKYSKTAFIYPLVPLTERAYRENDVDFLTATDKIFDIEILLDGAEEGITGAGLYWSLPLVRSNSSASDYSEFKKQYILACIKYYDTFLSERISTFLNSTQSRFSEHEGWKNTERYTEFYERNPVPFYLKGVGLKVFGFLSGETIECPFISLLWQPAIPVAIMLFAVLFCFFRRKYAYASILAASFIKSVLVFLTAPEVYFMYYFPTYLCGYFCMFFMLFSFIRKLMAASTRKTATLPDNR